jgi:serine/threonine protein kinase
MENMSLEEQIENPDPRFGPTEKSKVFFGVAVTMAEFHAMNVMHRDLKPANILLDQNFEPHLCDFGLARELRNPLTMTAEVGSPLYMAPEVWSPNASYGFPSDVYAYGMTMFNAFTNYVRFDDGWVCTNADDVGKHVRAGTRLEKSDDIPDPFWNLITSCWAQEPEMRPTFAQIVERMEKANDLVCPGTNLDEYREYQRRIIWETRNAVQNAPLLMKMGDERENGLLIRNMAQQDAQLRARMLECIRKRFTTDEDDQIYRPYDFLKAV